MNFNEPAVLSLFILILAAWFYYQDVHVQKLEFRRSRARFHIFGAIISYPLLTLVYRYSDSIRAYLGNDKVTFVVIGLVSAGIATALAYRKRRDRRETLENVARQLGLNFDPGSRPLPAELIQIPTFDSVGESVTNVMREEGTDHECTIFDHRYSFGEDSVAHTIAAYRISSLVPEFQLKPENVLDKLVAAFGGTDVDFPNYPTFSSAYRLVCDDHDEAVIRQMFSGSLCSLFEREQGWTIGGKGNWVGMYKHRILVESHNISAFYQQTKGIAKAIESAARSVGFNGQGQEKGDYPAKWLDMV